VEKYLPYRAPIEQFGAGGFRFAGMSHVGSLLILPSGMRVWRPTCITDVNAGDLESVIAEISDVDFLLLGTGATMSRLPSAVSAHLTGHRIAHDAMSTSAAIHTYNVVLAEGRRVAAALIAVDKAHGN